MASTSDVYKTEYDSRITEKLDFFYDTQMQLFKDSINAPIRYYNTQINVWSSSREIGPFGLFGETRSLSEEEVNELKINELKVD